MGLPAEPRARESAGSRGKRASSDPAEHDRQRRVELVGVHPPRHAEHVRDVFGAWGCESGVVQASKKPILGGERGRGEGRRRFQRQIAVGLSLQTGSGKKSLAQARSSFSSKESIDKTSPGRRRPFGER